MVWLTDGMYYDEACVMMSTLDLYRELGAAVVLRGHGGELARMHEAYELQCNRHMMACRGQASLKEQLLPADELWALRRRNRSVICAGIGSGEMHGAARASLDEAFADIDPAWHVVDQIGCPLRERVLAPPMRPLAGTTSQPRGSSYAVS